MNAFCVNERATEWGWPEYYQDIGLKSRRDWIDGITIQRATID